VYIGRGDGTLMSWSFTDRTLRDLGKVSDEAASLYALTVDDSGTVWGGSYPRGIIWNYKPVTQTFTALPSIDTDTDYVRGLTIRKGTLYAGTGSRNPKIVSFPLSNPGQRKIIPLPDPGDTGFVSQMFARGDRIFIYAEDAGNVTRCCVYNHRNQEWEGLYPGSMPIRSFSGTETTGSTLTVAGGNLVTITPPR